ncbi:MAG: hypothetical protein Q9225_004006 [Loekoesia sp. 1 TL-2023]
MARALKEGWELTGPILPLHDRPVAQFRPLKEIQRLEFLAQCPETAIAVDEIQRGTTKLLVSSTSWTPDEDFSLLLDALITYSDMAASTPSHLPNILAIITGKGPLKDAFLSKIKATIDEGRLKRVQLRTAWLSSEDYAKLLASADLGVSLHTSSSGVDLPMKVVDMLGAGLPVVGWHKFEAWPELIQEGINGRGFHSSAMLSDVLMTLFGKDPQQLQRLRQGAMLEGKRRWDNEWDPVAGKLLDDGELAVAAGDFVHLLIPRHGSRRDRQNASRSDPWVHISFRVNSFTANEWPPQELNELDSFCIGEEQSSSTVVALSWSPVCLAKHKRSALAVLTTNHILSLWASASDLKTASSWERVLVINNALQNSNQQISPQDDGDLPNQRILRRLARVQSMSWASIKPGNGSDQQYCSRVISSETFNPIQYLAITNDADEVVILQIKSPWLHYGCSSWETKTVCRATWKHLRSLFVPDQSSGIEVDKYSTVVASKPQWPSMLAHSMSDKAFIDWVIAGAIEHRWWNPPLDPADNTHATTEIQKGARTLQLTDEWDQVSASGNVLLLASGFQSGLSIFRMQSDPDVDDQAMDQSLGCIRTPLTGQISTLQKDFDRHYDLGGLSFAKTWGLASWGLYVASCVTFHPGDMVEYTLTSGERCHIIFDVIDTNGTSPEDASFPWQETSPSMHQENSQELHHRILTILTDQQLYNVSDYKILYCNCCAAILSGNMQNLELVEKAFQQLVTSTGINLELEFSLLETARDLRLSMMACIERLNEIAPSRISQEDHPHWHELYDFCSICDRIVVWTGTTEASCIAGHQFGMVIPSVQVLK